MFAEKINRFPSLDQWSDEGEWDPNGYNGNQGDWGYSWQEDEGNYSG